MTHSGWRSGGASVKGTRHAESTDHCQDVHRCVPLADGGILIAVADGAGSAEHALAGAQFAVDHLIARLTEPIMHGHEDEEAWRALIRDAFYQTHEALAAHATACEEPLRSFATTLSCVIMHDEWFVAGQIGDGVVVVETATGDLVTVLKQRRGEYATDTYFVTMPDSVQYLDDWITRDPITAVAVTTDGLVRLIMHLPAYTPGVPFFRPLLDSLRHANEDTISAHLTALLSSERVRAGTDDDTTLVLAFRDVLPLDAPLETPEGTSPA